MVEPRLPLQLQMQLLLRSLLLQASWNFERMQGLGVLYLLAPALRFYYRDAELSRAYGRHTEYFNTHPFLAPALLGATLRLELEQHSGATTALPPDEFKRMLMAPCAAMGDAFFWGGVRPLAAAVALLFAVQGRWWAPLVLLVLFNLPHLWFRITGFRRGFNLGAGLVELLQRARLPDRAIRLKQATVLLLGVLCAQMATATLRETGQHSAWGLTVLPAAMAIGWICRFSVSPLLLSLGAAVLILLFHFLFSMPVMP